MAATIKCGCKAHIVIREYILYVDYAVTNADGIANKQQGRLCKEKKLQKLRADLLLKKPVRTQVKYYVSLPTEEHIMAHTLHMVPT